MKAITTLLAGGAAIAAFACAAPAAAQYYPGYATPYGNPYGGYGYAANSQAMVNQCANAVQQRLGGYGAYGYGGGGRVLGISSVSPRDDGGIAVRGVAASGRYGGYGYGQQMPDLTWRCRTDFRGYIREVTINRAAPAYGYGSYTPWNYDYSQYGYRRY